MACLAPGAMTGIKLAAGKSGSPTKLSGEAVHSARKELKKARATLRLLRDALSDAVYKRENAALRDAARRGAAAQRGT
jgi:CHAD domain-containing protein